MQTNRKSKTPAHLIRSLLVAIQPGARLLQVDGTTFILNGKEHMYIGSKTYSAMIERGWITVPCQIEHNVAVCEVTRTGYAVAEAIEAQKRLYFQLQLCFEE